MTQTKADWLRSEIEKLEIECGLVRNILNDSTLQPIDMYTLRGELKALTSIITRYKEELLELDSK